MFTLTLSTLALLSTLTLAVPVPRADKLDTASLLKNGREAQNLNAQFKNLTASDACTTGQNACVNNNLAKCVDSKWELTICADSLACFAVPSLTVVGVNVTCTSERNALSAIKTTGASNEIALANTDSSQGDDDDNDNSDEDSCDSDDPDDSESSGEDDGDSCEAGDSDDGTGVAEKTKTVTVTVLPSTQTTVLPSAQTTIVSPQEASSILSSLIQAGASVSTVSNGSIPSQSSSSRTIIQLTEPSSPTPTPSSGNNAAAAADKPVLTFVSNSPEPTPAFSFGDF